MNILERIDAYLNESHELEDLGKFIERNSNFKVRFNRGSKTLDIFSRDFKIQTLHSEEDNVDNDELQVVLDMWLKS